MTVYYTCKKCEEKIEVDVFIGEQDDLPERCEKCDALIPDEAHVKVQEDAEEKARDRFFDSLNDGV